MPGADFWKALPSLSGPQLGVAAFVVGLVFLYLVITRLLVPGADRLLAQRQDRNDVVSILREALAKEEEEKKQLQEKLEEQISKLLHENIQLHTKTAGLGLLNDVTALRSRLLQLESEGKRKVEEVTWEPPALLEPENKGRVLVADDRPDVLDVLRRHLEMWGYEVECAVDGIEALRLHNEAENAGKPFDLLLLDQAMPRYAGHEVLRMIRIHGDTTVKIMFLTGQMQDLKDHLPPDEWQEYQVAAALLKPLNFEKLPRIVEAVLQNPVGADLTARIEGILKGNG